MHRPPLSPSFTFPLFSPLSFIAFITRRDLCTHFVPCVPNSSGQRLSHIYSVSWGLTWYLALRRCSCLRSEYSSSGRNQTVQNDSFFSLWSHKLKGCLTCTVCPEWPGIILWPMGEQDSLSQTPGPTVWLICAFHLFWRIRDDTSFKVISFF